MKVYYTFDTVGTVHHLANITYVVQQDTQLLLRLNIYSQYV